MGRPNHNPIWVLMIPIQFCPLTLFLFRTFILPSMILSRTRTFSFISLLKIGCTPTVRDFNKLLRFLYGSSRFNCIIHLFAQMNSNQMEGDFHTLEFYVKALINHQRCDEALDFLKFQIGKSENFHHSRIFEAWIQGLCKDKNDPEKGLFVLREYLSIDGTLPSFTFWSLIYSFSSLGKMDRVIQVLELMACEKCKYPIDNHLCSSVISGFVRIGKPELGISFFEDAVKSSALKPDLYTYTALMSAYIRLGRFEEIDRMVCRMENNGLKFNGAFYNNWIYGYFREGMIGEAFQKYKEMVNRKTVEGTISFPFLQNPIIIEEDAGKIEVNSITFTILIDGFSKDGNVEKAVGFLHKMMKDGLRPNLVTYTALMMGFCKKGKMDEAFALLKIVKDLGIKMDEVIYSILIDGVCRLADFDRAFQLLEEMENMGVKPSTVTYNTIISGLCKAGRTADADDIAKGIVGDALTHSILLHGYILEGNARGVLETKMRIEAAGVCMNVILCNVLIKASFMLGLFEDVLAIYKGMPEKNLVPDSIIYCTMIDGYCKAGMVSEAFEIFDDFQRASSSSAACYSYIIQSLCLNGMVDIAIEVFKELVVTGLSVDRIIRLTLINTTFNMKGAEGVLDLIRQIENLGGESFASMCNDAVDFLCGKGSFEAVFDVFIVMRRNKFAVKSKIYHGMLKALLFNGKTLTFSVILTIFLKQYGMSKPRVNRILLYYLSLKNVSKMLTFITSLKEESVDTKLPVNIVKMLITYRGALDSYNIIMSIEYDKLFSKCFVDYPKLIDGLCKEGHVDKALNVCNFAQKKGFPLSVAIYNSVINGLCRQGCIVEALRLLDSLERIDIIPSEITYGTLIDALSKKGHLLDAQKLLETMLQKNVKPNTHIYNSLIHGYCKLGQLQEALNLFLDLGVKGFKPDEFTISAVIYGYCLKGDMEGALGFFSDFKGKGMFPDFLGFMHLLRGLYAKGRMEESQGILRQMLQSQSVVDLLNRIESDIESESLQNFLVHLCEQGSIQDSIAVLDEIGLICFPHEKRPKTNEMYFKQNERCAAQRNEMTEYESLRCGHGTMLPPQNVPHPSSQLDKEISQPLDFDSYYQIVASLCSKGETTKANRLIQNITLLIRGELKSIV